MAVFNAVLDGVTTFSLFGTTYEWDDLRLRYASFDFGDGPPPGDVANLTLEDADWRMEMLRFVGDNPATINITDNSTSEVRIRTISLDTAGANIVLGNASVRSIFGSSDTEAVNITLGDEEIDAIDIGDGNNRITVGDGELGTLQTGNGDDRVIVGSGSLNSAGLRDGNHTVSVGADGWIGSLVANDGNDNVTVNGGYIEYADLLTGTQTVTLRNGGEIGTFRSDSGATTVTMEDDSRIMLMKMDRGTNTVSIENGWVEAFYSHEGTNTLNVGAEGGFATMTFSGTNQHQVIRAQGFIGAIQASDDISVDAVLNGGSDAVILAGGNDIVRTGNGYVTLINTRGGDDQVTVGRGAAGFVRTGDGDDIIRVTALNNTGFGVHMQGGGGTDTVNLSSIGGPLTATLSEYGTWQDVGSGSGYFAFTEIENLIGGIRADRLTGNTGDNVLTGGRGNDRLTGDDGIDTFVFARTTGRDTITDFEAGVDLLDIAGANRLSQLRFVDTGDDVQIQFGRARITILDATVAEVRDVDNFLF